MKARSSPATSASCLRSRRRRSAGSPIVSRRGYRPMGCSILSASAHDKGRKLPQPPGTLAAGLEDFQRLLEQLVGELLGLGKAEQAGIRRLARCTVLAGGLS